MHFRGEKNYCLANDHRKKYMLQGSSPNCPLDIVTNVIANFARKECWRKKEECSAKQRSWINSLSSSILTNGIMALILSNIILVFTLFIPVWTMANSLATAAKERITWSRRVMTWLFWPIVVLWLRRQTSEPWVQCARRPTADVEAQEKKMQWKGTVSSSARRWSARSCREIASQGYTMWLRV